MRNLSVRALACAALMAAAGPTAAQPLPAYRMTPIAIMPEDALVRPSALNDQGVVAGDLYNGLETRRQAVFRWTVRDGYERLRLPGDDAPSTVVRSIDARGVVAVEVNRRDTLLWGQRRQRRHVEGYEVKAGASNGDVVATTDGDSYPDYRFLPRTGGEIHIRLADNDNPEFLAMNALGMVVGHNRLTDVWFERPAVWTAERGLRFMAGPGFGGIAIAANDAGVVLVNGGGGVHTWTEAGGMTRVAFPADCFQLRAGAINLHGTVVGMCTRSAAPVPLIGSTAQGMQPLLDLVPDDDPWKARASIENLIAINGPGQILALGSDRKNPFIVGYLLTPAQ